jgi:hypothetical protein
MNKQMPQLVKGHVRFTAEDFLVNDYQATINEKYKKHSYEKLVARLKTDSEQLVLMKEVEVTAHFNTQENIANLLKESFAIVCAIAEREGYALKDLMVL